MPDTLLTIDIGLTNCKTVIFNSRGGLLARASVPYATQRQHPGWVEQDPEDWWRAILAGLAQLRETAPAAMSQIAAISVTGHMHALVCLGADGTSLGPALVLGDQRSLKEAAEIADAIGLQRIYELTGARMDASMPLAKICWLRKHTPGIHSTARAFLSCKDWVRHRLTGDVLTDPVDACGTSLYDIQRASWAPELVAMAGIRPAQLPNVADPCAIAGRLTQSAAALTDLQAGTPVVVGAGDDVEVLGNSLLSAGTSLEHLGTTGSILTCAGQPIYDPEMAVELYPHTLAGLWVLGGSVTAAGSAMAWAEEILRPWTPDGVKHPDQAWAPDLDSPLVFVPHLSGERCPTWEPHARGSWVGLSATHTTDHLRHAVLEGIVFSLKQVLERIENLVGPQPRITVSGREEKDEQWLSLRATIYNRPLALLRTSEPTALGAMIVGAVGTGMYGTLSEAVEAATHIERIIEPQPELAEQYEQLYTLYRESAETVGLVMRRWRKDVLNDRIA